MFSPRRSPARAIGAILGARALKCAERISGRPLHAETRDLSLINFHRVLIAFAILFCAGYAAYELVAFSRGGGNGALALSGTFFVFTAGLAYYLWRLKDILGVEE